MIKVENDYSPIVTVDEYNTQYDCPVSDLVNTKLYHIDLDHDPRNPVVYLNIGYDNLPELDSSIYISPEDAINLASKLLEYGTMTMKNKSNAAHSRLFLNTLEDYIKNHKVSELNIYPCELANQDYFPGCMIIDLEYYLKDENDKSYSAKVLSCNFLAESDKVLSEDLFNTLKDKYDIEVIKCNLEKFEELYTTLLDKFKKAYSIPEDEFEEYTDKAFTKLKENLLTK